MKIRLGTRGSALALTQTGLVAGALGGLGHRVELIHILTDGDVRAPDTPWGEGAFVAALERALARGQIDLAVHSAKDVPIDGDPGLTIAAYPPRDDPRDVLVSRDPAGTLAMLPPGAVVGTDSPRRSGFLRAARPDARVVPLSGNVDTRLRRLDDGEVDALILAAAGLRRLGRTDRISQFLDPASMPPAPGQGALAVQARADDRAAIKAGGALDDAPTRLCVEVERAVLQRAGGGCRAPLGALAVVEGDRLTVLAAAADPDGSWSLVRHWTGRSGEAERAGSELAAALLAAGYRDASAKVAAR